MMVVDLNERLVEVVVVAGEENLVVKLLEEGVVEVVAALGVAEAMGKDLELGEA